MERLLEAAVERGASVIHIKAGDVFRARIDGRMVKLSSQVFAPEEVRQIALKLISVERDRARIDSLRDYDTSWDLAGVGRFRVNILRQRGVFMIIMRVIPLAVPTLDELNLPPVLGEIAEFPRGIVLITGAVGTGKSNTLAAMIAWINGRLQKHIVTLEDPIEFLHTDDVSTVTQREIGVDTASFREGLRAALRQDADVILIGEMRDRETVATAIRAAELGLLVISTMHSATAVGAIGQLLGAFEEDEADLARSRVADTLKAVIAQRLLPRSGAETLIPAIEVLRVTGAVRDCILNARPPEEITELMEQGAEAYGMRT
ncbi:MAG: type IV pilus twitching motility protein PilT, partial [Gemmatimonadota bacterium]